MDSSGFKKPKNVSVLKKLLLILLLIVMSLFLTSCHEQVSYHDAGSVNSFFVNNFSERV